uniref:Uncharacterized protein n=1 Tax=viral metagenome TaxID=1070528 RepID=A0A6C0APN2_9ZZZZ
MPYELVREILKWIRLFQIAEMTERINTVRQTYGHQWDSIMADIRMNIPRYTTTIIGTQGSILRVSIFCPNCDPTDWYRRTINDLFTSMERRALSIHREFITEASNKTTYYYSILE